MSHFQFKMNSKQPYRIHFNALLTSTEQEEVEVEVEKNVKKEQNAILLRSLQIIFQSDSNRRFIEHNDRTFHSNPPASALSFSVSYTHKRSLSDSQFHIWMCMCVYIASPSDQSFQIRIVQNDGCACISIKNFDLYSIVLIIFYL